MKVVSSLNLLKKEILIVKQFEDEANFTSLIKKTQNLKHDKVKVMDIDPQRKTWSNFIKLTTYTSVAIVVVLALMAIFLL